MPLVCKFIITGRTRLPIVWQGLSQIPARLSVIQAGMIEPARIEVGVQNIEPLLYRWFRLAA
jgi:hypothetical protein